MAVGSVNAGYRGGRWPFKNDVGLIADGAPDSDAADVLTGFGAVEMVIPTVEHRLAATRPTKHRNAQLPRNIDLHFVHRKGAALAKRFDLVVPAERLRCGPIIYRSAYCAAPAPPLARQIVSFDKEAEPRRGRVRDSRRRWLGGSKCRAAHRHDRCWLAYSRH